MDAQLSRVLERLAARHRITAGFTDNTGAEFETSDDCRQKFLMAMDVPCETAPQAELMEQLEIAETWQLPVDTFMACRMNEANEPLSPEIELRVPEGWTTAEYQIVKAEDGTITGTVELADLPCSEETDVGEISYRRLVFTVPETLGPGFHWVHFTFKEESKPVGEKASIEVLVHQHACYLPPDTMAGRKKFGFEVFPRCLQSGTNWGAGNLPDIRKLGCALAAKGADFLFVPPMVTNEPLWGYPSPYYTTTRRQANHQHVGLEAAMEEFDLSECLAAIREQEVQETLQQLRDMPTIAYTEHDPLVVYWLERMCEEFFRYHQISPESLWDDNQGTTDDDAPEFVAEFRKFVRTGGDLLEYIDYALAREVFFSRNNLDIVHPEGWNFRTWPLGFQHPGAERLVKLRQRSAKRAGFYAFILWLGRRELQGTQEALVEAGMGIGLWMALAVGSAQGGADHFADQDVALDDLEMGAPGDALAPDPQKWNMRLRGPQRRRKHRYGPLRRDLDFTMPCVGGVFVDHGMIVERVFGVLRELEGLQNAYVEYERDEILGILAYYSHKYQRVVGVEAVGTIPEGFTDYVQEWNVIVYYIQRFTRSDWESRDYLLPGDYSWFGLVCNANHDIAPPAGYWHGWDIMLWQNMGYPEDEIERIKTERDTDRRKFLKMLVQEGLVSQQDAEEYLALVVRDRPVGPQSLLDIEAADYPEDLLVAEAVSVLRSNSAYAVLDLHSLLGHKRMLNAPSIDQPKDGQPGYESWLQRTGDVDAIVQHPTVTRVLEQAAIIRP